MCLLPFSTGTTDGVISLGMPFLALLALGQAGGRIAGTRPASRNSSAATLGFLLIVALSAATLYAPEHIPAVARLIPNIIGFVVFLFLLSGFESGDVPDFEPVAKVYVLSATILALYFLATFLYAVAEVGLAGVFVDRITGGVFSLPWGASNVVASTLILPVFLTFYFSGERRGSTSAVVFFVARIILLLGIGVTISRGAIFATGLGFVVLSFVSEGKLRRNAVGFLLFLAVAGIILDQWMGGLISDQLVSAFLGRLQDADVSDLNGRTELWDRFGEEFGKSPLLGIGYYGSLFYFESSGHDLVLTTLVERGIIGFALSSAILVKAAVTTFQSWRRPKPEHSRNFFGCMLAGGVASLVHLMVEDANFTQQYIVYSWVALALVFMAERPSRTPRQPGVRDHEMGYQT
jgi:hypothetical protein